MIPKFRVWDKNTEDMVDVKTIDLENDGSIGCIVDYSGINLDISECVLMQSTGLKDKNGVEIFEGDIVRHSEVITDISIVRFGEFGVPNFGTEEYQDYAIGFYYENASEFKDIEPFNMTAPLNSEYAKDVAIVGNIYEQPELIGNP